MSAHFAGEMHRAAKDIIEAAQAGSLELAHYRIGALVGMAEANAAGIEVWWDEYDRLPPGGSSLQAEAMTDAEALDEISRILSAEWGSGAQDIDRIAEVVQQSGRQVGLRFRRPLIHWR